ncbi:TolC family protein [Maribacter algicola]|uniref:TolC family protein n=1 Tax=Meishania litoralis TaxID=3434685 RepID=A0ACC7LFE2_9FLAO
MNSRLTALLIVFSVGILSAQNKKWTLQECVEYALEHNITIQQSELDLKDAEVNKLDAKGNFLPSINAQASHSWNIGLNQNVTTGILENLTTMFTSGGVGMNVDLYNGLQNVNRLRRSNLALLANQYRLDNMKDDISLAVANGYLQILFNRENLVVAKAQYAVTEQDLKRTTELVESGVVARGDLLEIEATAATQLQQIVNSENNLRLSKIALAQLLLINDYENFDVANEEFNIQPTTILNNSPSEIFAKAVTQRNEIKFAEANIELAETDIELAKGALYPRLSGFYNYNTRASYQDIIGGFEIDPNNPTTQIGTVEGTGQAVVAPNRRPIVEAMDPFIYQLGVNDGHSFGVGLNIPILNGFSARNSVKRNRINLERSKLQLDQAKLDLENVINQAWNDAQAAIKAHEAAQKTLDARRLAYDYSKERFDVGLMNAFDFSQAQSRLDNAQAEVIRTKFDYIFRVKVLEFYFGLPIELK